MITGVSGRATVYVDTLVIGATGEPLLISFYERSAQQARAFGASLVLEGRLYFEKKQYYNADLFNVTYVTVTVGKEVFTHGIALAQNIRKNYLVTVHSDEYKDLYNFLMNHYDLPLLEEWMPEIFAELKKRKFILASDSKRIRGNQERVITKGTHQIPIKELLFYRIVLDENTLCDVVSQLLSQKRIWISKKPQKRLSFENLDEYFRIYGKTIVDNLQKILSPVSELNGEISRAALKKKRLYPQQAAMVNGVYEYLSNLRKGYVLFCMGTGSGKTIQAACAAEMLYVGKWLRQNPGKSLKDAYEEDGIINYRHVIMAPGHLVKKWQRELRQEIPYAKTVIVESLKQLVELRKARKERNGKEYYIVSKDLLKLSYQRIPTPKKIGRKYVSILQCGDCNCPQTTNDGKCSSCGSTNIKIIRTHHVREGLICPFCNRLVYTTSHMRKFLEEPQMVRNAETWPLQWYDMVDETRENQNCLYCGEGLWMPYVKNINTELGYEKEPAWIRQTFWTNCARKGKITRWVLRGHESEALSLWGECLNSMEDSTGGARKYSPALFIKKYLKGCIDVFIADEVHKAKGGSTAQGNAFHCLAKTARYTMGLTGTIAGGVATDLYYLLFRLEPGRMIERGYGWGSIMKFASEYGCVETEYEVQTEMKMNKCFRGAVLRQPRVLPGISPLVFSEFLLDRAVFLEIADMSANMPPLYEKIVLIGANALSAEEKKMHRAYHVDVEIMKSYARENKVQLSSARNQFEMSYLDKPYGVSAILDPKTGDPVVLPGDYSDLVSDGKMLAKEKALIELVQKELSENRNCVVYVEYSQSEETNILPRLRELLRKECGLHENEVVAMRSNTPKAIDREAWMHRKAEEGMRVMLCNPRLCETGLDFCWEANGAIYNFPTLFFYQCGYSLFVIWQASGRSWRLNQREECRTYYLAYANTVQQAILQVLGEKKAATAAIQGRFSAEGLAAMARGVDTQVRIAQIMSEMDEDSGNRLQDMFDVIASSDDTYTKCNRMMLYAELTGRESDGMDIMKIPTYYGMFGAMQGIFGVGAGKDNVASQPSVMEELLEEETVIEPFDEELTKKENRTKKKSKLVYYSLLDEQEE